MFKRFMLQLMMLLLVAGSAWAADPALDLGTGSGNVGTVVSVPVTFTSNGADVASVGMDIAYDPTALSVTLASSVTLTTLATDAGFSVSKSLPSAGVLRIALLNLGGVVQVPNGVVANVKFTPLKAGTFTLTNTPSAADGAANPTVVTGANGSVTGIGVSQTITFGAAPSLAFGGTATVSATASSALPVTFSSTTPLVCSVAGSTVTPVTTGTCTVAANQAGNATFAAAPQVTQNITITQGSQTLSFGAAPSLTFGGPAGTLSATATSGLPATFSSTTPAVCTVAGSSVTPVTAGTCIVAANQAGNANFTAAAQVTQSIPVAQAAQTITFGAAPSLTFGGTATVSATSTSGLTVAFSSTTPTVCTVAGSTVTPVTTGACVVAANQAGNGNVLAASQVTQSITIAAANQTISFGAAPTLTFNGPAGTLSATATSTLPVTFSSTTPTICTVAGSSVTPVATGACIVAANQGGNANFNAAPQVTQSITVNLANQTISFGAAPSLVFNGPVGTLSATATSALPVTFSSTTPTICTVAGTSVTPVLGGTCIVAANQAGNGSFNPAAQVTQSITVAKAGQTITFGAAPSLTFGGAAGALSATSTSALPVTFSSTTPTICTVAGSSVTPVAGGTCIVAANQAGTTDFAAAPQVTQSITVAKAGQTITFGAAPSLVFTGTAQVSATASSALPVTFSSTTPAVCTVAGTTVTPVAVGSCIVAANQAGNGNFQAAGQVTQSITITQGNQTISFGTAPSVIVGGTGTLSATASSGLTVTFGTSTPTVCSVSGSTVTGILESAVNNNGPCIITANQGGNTNFLAATQATQSINIVLLGATVGAPSAAFAKTGTDVTFTVTYAGAQAVTLSAADVHLNTGGTTATGTVAVSGTGLVTRTVTISNLAGNGTIGITIGAGTATGNGNTAGASNPSATFIVDNAAPALNVNTLANGTITSNQTLTITGSVTDLNGVATLTVNGTAVTPALDGSFSFADALVAGANTVTVVATDNAGNTATDTRSVTFDHTAPVITFVAPTPADQSVTAQASATITGTLNKPGTVTVTVGTNAPIQAVMTGTSFSAPVTLGLGSNTIVVTAADTAVDQSGNPAPNTATVQRIVTFDNTKPALAITDPAQDFTTTLGSVLIQGTVSDTVTAVTLDFKVDGVSVTPAPAITNGTFQQSVTLNTGKTYALIVTATDEAGNVTTAQRNIVFRPLALADALRALQISVGAVQQTTADSVLDVGPLVNNLPQADGTIDISDALLILRKTVGLVTW